MFETKDGIARIESDHSEYQYVSPNGFITGMRVLEYPTHMYLSKDHKVALPTKQRAMIINFQKSGSFAPMTQFNEIADLISAALPDLEEFINKLQNPDELGDVEVLFGYTNDTMARLATRKFGFKYASYPQDSRTLEEMKNSIMCVIAAQKSDFIAEASNAIARYKNKSTVR